ncbi:MAG: phosphatase PAP2 family protein [Thermanaerothrix sp.]|nr:phosphatase PAP2 family protein [Thermanaerothrix sp.]
MRPIRRILDLDVSVSFALTRWAGQHGLQKIARLISHSADSWVWLGVFLLVGVLVPSLRCWAGIGFVATFLLASLVFVLKALIRRERPQPANDWIYALTDEHSFPSGHAARCVLITVLALHFERPEVILGLVIWAILVSLSRLALGVHYVTDVLVGMLLGGMWGGLVLNYCSILISLCGTLTF